MEAMSSDGITREIIGAAIRVSNTLGVGFLEKIYERAMAYELSKRGLGVEEQKPIAVTYDGIVLGEYFVDLLVHGSIVVEIKAAKAIDISHQAQVLNYLRATNLHIGLILNFGTSRLGIKRICR